jgi:hypothetical protein
VAFARVRAKAHLSPHLILIRNMNKPCLHQCPQSKHHHGRVSPVDKADQVHLMMEVSSRVVFAEASDVCAPSVRAGRNDCLGALE